MVEQRHQSANLRGLSFNVSVVLMITMVVACRGQCGAFQLKQFECMPSVSVLTLLVMSALTPRVLGDYDRLVLEDKPAVYFRFDEVDTSDGKTAQDFTLNHTRSVYQGAVTSADGVPGTDGRAARFNGRSGRVDVSLDAHLKLDTISIEFWFQSKQAFDDTFWPGSAAFLTIATRGPGSQDWTINAATTQKGVDQGRVMFLTGPSRKSDNLLYSPTGYPLNDGRWHHVVATRSESGKKQLYIDGKLAGSQHDPGGSIVNDMRPLQIGGEQVHRGGRYFDGVMDEVAIYPHVLSADRVEAHYKAVAAHLPPRKVVFSEAGKVKRSPAIDVSKLPPALDRKVSFVKDIKPLLTIRCFDCHGPRKEEGGLNLSMKRRAMEGGDSGAAILSGDLQGSRLLHRVAGLDGKRRMPPKGDPLPPEDVALLRTWIEQGAAWPDGYDVPDRPTRVARSHWSFQPIRRPDVPDVKEPDWVRNPIDAFILARLEEASAEPAPRANRHTLLRRATFDLHGLPPTLRQIDQFVNDNAGDDDAWLRLVDQLLASEHYGERYGRFWLDVVRYADSAGYELDTEYDHAWRYRDYVIASLNADKPFGRFITEQLAADQLWPDDNELKYATGFFTVGPFRYEGGIARAEAVEYERRTDAADTIGVALMGMTVGCARCHSHKYDPITQRDYFALQAIVAEAKQWDVVRQKPPDNGSDRKKPQHWIMRDLDELPAVHLLYRGDLDSPGPVIRPGTPRVLPGGGSFDRADDAPGRRAQLARWLVSKQNPLTARVIVNRVWQWHFGTGLVATPDDLGTQGKPPTYPQLLDWLAAELMANKWSLKYLHRLIMTSSTYRMSSVSAESNDKQPDSSLLAFYPRRRLDAEAIWDNIHATSGSINFKQGGPPVYPPIDKSAIEAKRNIKWNSDDFREGWTRRAVYMVSRRSLVHPFFDTFNAPLPVTVCGRRDTTVVAPQALTMLNDEMVVREARTFAGRLLRECGDDNSAIVARAWLLAFGRPVSDSERKRALAFLSRAEARLADAKSHPSPIGLPDTIDIDAQRGAAVVQFCLALMNANEFVYVD